MKRILCLLLILSTLLLCACGETTEKENKDTWKPDVASEDVEPYAEQAIKIIDQYLNFEISNDEAKDKMSELYVRMISLGIDTNSEKYNEADQIVYSTIDDLYWLSIRSDVELRQTQDILRIQMGKKTKESKYNYKNFSLYSNDDALCTFIDFESIPAQYINVEKTDDEKIDILLFFDYMYDVSSKDVISYVGDILSKTKENSVTADISIHYTYYEQPVFTLSLIREDDSFHGAITNGASTSEKFKILEKFNSEEEFNEVLSSVAAYLH